MTASVLGLGVMGASLLIFLATLGLRRTLPTWIFDLAMVVGALLAASGRLLVAHAPTWPAIVGPVGALVWFAATRLELRLPRAGEMRVRPGDRLPDVALKTTTGATLRTGELGSRGPVLLVLYRGWWCPYCVTQLGELERHHDALSAAGLSIYAISVDRPDEQVALEKRLAGRVTFLSDERGALLDALGVRHPDGVPWYDRLLFGARKQDIAMPVSLVLDAGGTVRFARRARRIDDRPSVKELAQAASAARS
jgi:peroxiredoxin